MADKNVTIIEPTASDIQAVTIFYDDAGNPMRLEINAKIRASDKGVSHTANCETVPDDYSAAIRTQLAILATEAAALLAAAEKF